MSFNGMSNYFNLFLFVLAQSQSINSKRSLANPNHGSLCAITMISRELKNSKWFLTLSINNTRKDDLKPHRTFPFVDKVEEEILAQINSQASIFTYNNEETAGRGGENEASFRYFRSRKVHATVIFIENYNAEIFHKSLGKWVTNPFWSSWSTILVIIEAEVKDMLVVSEIVQKLWDAAIATDVYIIAKEKDDVYTYSWAAYNPTCKVSVSKVAKCLEYIANVSMYITKDNKFENLNKCKLLAATTELSPFIFDNNKQGFELKILETLAEIMNFTYNFVGADKNESAWVPFNDKGQPSGLLKILIEHRADFLFHGVRVTWDRYKFLEAIDTHYLHSFVWIAPLPEHVAIWKYVYLVFDVQTWLLVLLAFLSTAWLLDAMLGATLCTGQAFLIPFGALMNNPQAFPSQGLLSRLCLALYFIYALNISAAYQAGLFKIMSKGIKETSIEVPLDLAKEGYQFQIYPSLISDLRDNEPALFNHVNSHNTVTYSENIVQILRDISYQKKHASLLSEVAVTYNRNLRFSSKNKKPYLRFLKERFANYAPVFYMTRQHPLKHKVQKLIRRLIEHGWVNKFVEDVMCTASMSETYSESKKLDKQVKYYNEKVDELETGNIIGALLLFIGLSATSILVFTCEIVWRKYTENNAVYLVFIN